MLATDTAGRVTRMNPVAERLTGWRTAEAAGRPIGEVFRIVHEDTRAPASIPVQAVLDTGQVQGLADSTTLIVRDGGEVPIADSAAPIRDAEGRTLGVVLVFRDVSEERRAQRAIVELNETLEQRVRERTAELAATSAALTESELHFAAFFEVASVGIVQVDPRDGRFLRWNRRFLEITGYSGADLGALNFGALTHPDDREADWALFARARSGELPGYENEKRYLRKDGSVVWVRINATLLRDAAGVAVRTVRHPDLGVSLFPVAGA